MGTANEANSPIPNSSGSSGTGLRRRNIPAPLTLALPPTRLVRSWRQELTCLVDLTEEGELLPNRSIAE